VVWFTVYPNGADVLRAIALAPHPQAAAPCVRLSLPTDPFWVIRHVLPSSPGRRHGPHRSHQPAKDSTLAILLAAQARGWEIFYAEQRHLYLRDGIAMAHLARLELFDDLRTGSRAASRAPLNWASST